MKAQRRLPIPKASKQAAVNKQLQAGKPLLGQA